MRSIIPFAQRVVGAGRELDTIPSIFLYALPIRTVADGNGGEPESGYRSLQEWTWHGWIPIFKPDPQWSCY